MALLIAVFIVLKIVIAAVPAVRQYGLGFLTGQVWDPHKKVYSILPEIWGTLYSSVFALILGTAFGVAAAIFLAEGFVADGVFALLKTVKLQFHPVWGKLPRQVDDLLLNLIELLAAIPSVVYGLWGLFVVIPLMRPACHWLHAKMGWIPLFGTDLSGPGMLPAVIVLSIMILPTITAIGRGALVGGAFQAADGCLRVGCDAMGDDSRRDRSLGVAGHFRRRGARVRPRAGRNHGAGDAAGKRRM